MKLIYKDNRYPCILKSEMEKNMWYSMEPVKLTVTIPLVEYFNMRTDITECDNEFHFRLLVDKNDKVYIIDFGHAKYTDDIKINWFLNEFLNDHIKKTPENFIESKIKEDYLGVIAISCFFFFLGIFFIIYNLLIPKTFYILI